MTYRQDLQRKPVKVEVVKAGSLTAQDSRVSIASILCPRAYGLFFLLLKIVTLKWF